MKSVSVVICSHNRVKSLERTLISLDSCEIPEHHVVQLVVVLNNCADDSLARCCKFFGSSKLTGQVLEESRQGLAYARNTGVEAVSKGLIIFLDDDMTVVPTFFRTYADAASEFLEI